MPNWQDSRKRAHDEGRHSRPQVDCQYCWDAGRFLDLEKLRREESGVLFESEPSEPEPEPPEQVPVHDGRHGESCMVCAAVWP